MKSKTVAYEKLKTMCTVAMFCALAYICIYLPSIKVQFLTFDAKDSVMAICAMMLGPVWGVVIALITSLLEMITVSTTGPWGMLMNFVSSACFVFVASLIYKYKHSVFGAVLGLSVSSIITTGVMVGANLLITPLYLGVSTADVSKLIPVLLLPFNITKYILNSALVMLLYKPCVTALRRVKMVKGKDTVEYEKKRVNTSIMVTVCSIAVIAACIAILLIMNKT